MRLKTFLTTTLATIMILAIINMTMWSLLAFTWSPLADVYNDGLTIKIKPLKTVMVFAHGHYGELPDGGFGHMTSYEDIEMPTIYLASELKSEGYNYIWGSWCHSGDYDYIYRFEDGEEIPWPEWVSRNEKPGKTIPVFVGFGFVRLSA